MLTVWLYGLGRRNSLYACHYADCIHSVRIDKNENLSLIRGDAGALRKKTLCGNMELFMDTTEDKIYCKDNKSVLTISLEINSTEQGGSQVSIGMMLLSVSDTSAYNNFLQRWWMSINEERTIAKPSAVMIDHNWPSTHATSLIFNVMDVIHYLHVCFRIVERRKYRNTVDI